MKITEQNCKEKLWKLIIEYNRNKSVTGDDIQEFMQSLITSIKQEERERILNSMQSVLKPTSITIAGEPCLIVKVNQWFDHIQSLTEEDVINSK